jgi:hypothetical protein
MPSRVSLSTRALSPAGAILSAVARSSPAVHHRCPVMTERSSASCPSVSTDSSWTRTQKKASAPKKTSPSAVRQSPLEVATTGPRSASARTWPVSSASSRTAASSRLSPRCTPPPGVNQAWPRDPAALNSRIRPAGSSTSKRAVGRKRGAAGMTRR